MQEGVEQCRSVSNRKWRHNERAAKQVLTSNRWPGFRAPPLIGIHHRRESVADKSRRVESNRPTHGDTVSLEPAFEEKARSTTREKRKITLPLERACEQAAITAAIKGLIARLSSFALGKKLLQFTIRVRAMLNDERGRNKEQRARTTEGGRLYANGVPPRRTYSKSRWKKERRRFSRRAEINQRGASACTFPLWGRQAARG